MHKVVDLPDNPFRDKSHHGDAKFRNPPGSAHGKDGRYSVAMLGLLAELAVSGNRPFDYPPEHVLGRNKALSQLKQHMETDAISWLGQACFYMTVSGVSVLTDPFLSHRASPMTFSGPRRLVPAPVHINDLPTLDVIVISHNHYDHLDVKTLSRWHNKTTPVITPLGCGEVIRKLGYNKVIELDWYQQVEVKGMQFTCCPAYHFSGRSLLDSNRSLWGSFHIQSREKSVFFAGDTGYGEEFKRIAQMLGAVDIALVPIGAYSPREVMAKVHADPEEGIAIGCDLAAKCLIPMHWGTIRLTNESMMEPRYRFEKRIKELMSEYPNMKGEVVGIGDTHPLSRFG